MKTTLKKSITPGRSTVLRNVLIKLSVLLLLSQFQIHQVWGQSFLANDPNEYRFMVSHDYDSVESFGYTLYEQVMLRMGSYFDSERMAEVPLNTKLILLEESENVSELNGVSSRWYRCKVDGTDVAEGWVWGGNLAISRTTSKKDPETVFLAGISSRVEKTVAEAPEYRYYESKATVKVVREHSLLDERHYAGTTEFPVFSIDNLGNKGLSNIEDVLVVSNLCEYCGCDGSDHYFFWNGTNLQPVMNAKFTPDGSFSSGTYLVFPEDEGGEKGMVKIMKEDIVDEFKGNEGEYVSKRVVYESDFTWDGKLMQPVGAKKLVDSQVIQ